MADPIWLQRAKSVLMAATLGERSAGPEVAELLKDEAVGRDGVDQAILFWIDCMIDAAPPGSHADVYPVPDIWPADMLPEQRWSVRLLGARLNNDQEAVDKLLSEAVLDFADHIDCVLAVAIMAGLSLRSRATPQAE